MAARRWTRVLPVLVLAAIGLVLLPLTTQAASGLPPSVRMQPPEAGPGAMVELTGIDYPAARPVIIELATLSGVTDVAVLMTTESGYFRDLVVLPPDIPPGAWELRATAVDGPVASYRFEAVGGAEGLPMAAAAGSSGVLAGSRGNSGTDVVVMVVLAVMLAALGSGAAFAWREVRGDARQPGMGAGDDPIWSTAGVDFNTEMAAAPGMETPPARRDP